MKGIWLRGDEDERGDDENRPSDDGPSSVRLLNTGRVVGIIIVDILYDC